MYGGNVSSVIKQQRTEGKYGIQGHFCARVGRRFGYYPSYLVQCQRSAVHFGHDHLGRRFRSSYRDVPLQIVSAPITVP